MTRQRWQTIADRFPAGEIIGAEIGVHRGNFAITLLDNIPNLRTLILVDLWTPDVYAGYGNESASEPFRRACLEECNDNYHETLRKISKYNDRVIIIKGDSFLSAQKIENKSIDFAFIDANHATQLVKADCTAWIPKIKPGGYICGHDYPNFTGVVRAVHELFGDDFEVDADYTWFKKIS